MSIISEKLEDIRNYLDIEVHPVVSPDRWDVYSELCDMVDDIIALLKAQEPQVLSVEAVRNLTRFPVWLDVKSTHKDLYRGWVLAYMVQKGMGITGERLGMADPSGRMHWYKLDDYGRTWRVWDSIPTDTKKEAIPW